MVLWHEAPCLGKDSVGRHCGCVSQENIVVLHLRKRQHVKDTVIFCHRKR